MTILVYLLGTLLLCLNPALATPAMPPEGLSAADWQSIQQQIREGRELPARMGVAGQVPSLTVADAGAVYPLTIDPVVAVPGAYLKASNADAGDEFGYAVAVSGDTVVVGARNEAGNDAVQTGAAYVFVRSGDTWTQQAYLKADNAESRDEFGFAVAVSGDTVVVGAPFEDSNATTIDGDGSNNDAPGAGAAYVFVRSGDTWTQQTYLKAHNAGAGDVFGRSVAVSDNTVVVGAYSEDSNVTTGDGSNNDALSAGAAYVFVRSVTAWEQQAYLKADNAEADDWFGFAVAIDGDTVAVGAPYEASNASTGNGSNNDAPKAGAAYVFARSGTAWSQQTYLKADNAGENDYFGWSVAVSGDTVVVGAPNEDSNATTIDGNSGNNDASDAGAAYVFARSGTAWSQQVYLKADNAEGSDQFGRSVAVSGDTVVVGAPFDDSNASTGDGSNNEALNAGAAYIFASSGVTWEQQTYLKAHNAGASDWFGYAVAVSGDTVVVGAHWEDSNATTVDGDGSNNEALNAGSAYVFDLIDILIFDDGFES